MPTIHIGYDEYTFGHRYITTSAFQQRQTHNRRPLRLAAARVITDESQLLPAIERYLRDPSQEREARRMYAEAECGALDGRASERLAAMLAARVTAGKSA